MKEIKEVYIPVSSGYQLGVGMDAEKIISLYEEYRLVFESIGYTFHSNDQSSSCPIAVKGDSGFYLHPMEITGRASEEDANAVFAALKKHSGSFKIGEMHLSPCYMCSDEEYIAYLDSRKPEIEADIVREGFSVDTMKLGEKYGLVRPYRDYGVNHPGTCSLNVECVYIEKFVVAHKRKIFFEAVGMEDDGRITPYLTREELAEFEKGKECGKGCPPKSCICICGYFDLYHDVSIFFDPKTGLIYEDRFYIGE